MQKRFTKIFSFVLSLLMIFSMFAPNLIYAVGNQDKDIDTIQPNYIIKTYTFFEDPDPLKKDLFKESPYKDNPYIPLWNLKAKYDGDGRVHPLESEIYRTIDGKVTYCLDFGKLAPYPDKPIDANRTKLEADLLKVVQNGYPFKKGADYGVSDAELEWATAVALKMTRGIAWRGDHSDSPVQNKYLTLPGMRRRITCEPYLTKEHFPDTITEEESSINIQKADKVLDLVETIINNSKDSTIYTLDIKKPESNVFSPSDDGKYVYVGPLTFNFNNKKISDLTYSFKGVPFIPHTIVDVNFKETQPIANKTFYIKFKYSDLVDNNALSKPITLKVSAPGIVVPTQNAYITDELRFTTHDPQGRKIQEMYVCEPKTLQDSFEFKINRLPYEEIELTKKDSKTNTPLKNAKFMLESTDLTPDKFNEGPYVSNEEGKINLKLVPGSYVLKEIEAPLGYHIKDSIAAKFTITPDFKVVFEKGSTVILNDENNPVLKKVDKKGNPLAGAVIAITNSDGQAIPNSPFTTDKNGQIVLSKIPAGTYTYTEIKAPAGYVLDNTPHMFTVKPDGTIDENMVLVNEDVEVIINKISEEDSTPLMGAEIQVYDDKDNLVTPTPIKTNSEGKAKISNLAPGKYYFKEVKAPNGYILSNDSYNFEVSTDGKVSGTMTISNKQISTKIVKLDKTTNNPLPGAQFKITNEEGIPLKDGYFETDINGEIELKGLTGTFIITEVKAPAGYLLDNTPHTIVISEDGSVEGDLTLYNEQNQTKITKVDLVNGTPIPRATIEIYDNKGNLVNGKAYITDSKGEISLSHLAPGKYTFKETVAPDGYLLNESTAEFVVAEDGTISGQTTLTDEPISAVIIKRDGNTKKPIKGTELALFDENGKIIERQLTDSEGKCTFYFNRHGSGKYSIKEMVPTPGYVNTSHTIEFEIIPETKFPEEVIYLDNYPNEFILTKLNIDKDKALEGAQFEFFDSENNSLGVFTTNKEGKITLRKLTPGTYTYKEVKAPAGYILDEKVHSFEVDENGKVSANMTILNAPIKTVISKIDSKTGAPLKGATFEIKSEKAIVARETTNENGLILLKGLSAGKYMIQEIKAPDGYVLDPTVYTFTINTDGTLDKPLTFKNERIEVELYKKDSKSNLPLPGAQFVVKDSDNNVICDAITDDSGKIVINKISVGEYTLQEINPPAGYTLNKEIYKFTVKADGSIEGTTTIYNDLIEIKTKVEISKTDVTTGKLVPGAHLEIRTLDGKVITSWISGEKPHVFTGLKKGSYLLVETLPPVEDGYVTAESVKFEVKDINDIQKVEMKDDYTKINISKTDITTGEELPGANLEIRDTNNNIIEKWTSTDKSHYIEKLPMGDYFLVESTAPDGYVTSEVIKFTVKDTGKIQKVEMKDDYTKIEISKTDITTGKELPGAKLEVRDSKGNLVEEWTSTDKPHYIEKLPVGKYTLTEVTSPDGYTKAETIEFVVKNTGEIQKVSMKDDYTKIEISKTDITTGKELPGAKLEVRDSNGNLVEEWISTDKPHYIEKLPAGEYTLTETTAPDGYVTAETIKFTVKETNEIQKVIMKDDYTKVEISKTDITTGKELPGAKLEVRDSNGNLIEEWTSTDKPHMIERLPAGEYTLTETMSPDGYTKAETIDFTVKETAEIQKVEMKDDYTKIEISKTDITTGKELPGAKLEVRDSKGNLIEEWISTDKPHMIEKLPSGEYTLTEITAPNGYTKAETIKFTVKETTEIQKVVMKDDYTKVEISKVDISNDAELPGAKLEVRDSNGNLVEKWVSTDKPHMIEKLPSGEYTLTETTAPDGYVTAETIKFTVKETGEIQKVIMKDDYTKIEISKTDITNGKELPGAKLEVRDSKGNLIEEWVSTDKPHMIEKLPTGEYTLTEITAPNGYVTAETIKFTVKETGEIQKVEMKDDITRLEVLKIDAISKKALPGAKMQILNSKGDILYSWTSTDKPIGIERIPVGNYVLRETKAPKGYKVAEDIKFKVTDSSEVVKITMADELDKVIPTGDNSSNANYSIILLGIAALTVAAFVLKKKRHN